MKTGIAMRADETREMELKRKVVPVINEVFDAPMRSVPTDLDVEYHSVEVRAKNVQLLCQNMVELPHHIVTAYETNLSARELDRQFPR